MTPYYENKIKRRCKKNGIFALWTFDTLDIKEYISNQICSNVGTWLTKGYIKNGRKFISSRKTYIETPIHWPDLGTEYTISLWIKINKTSKFQAIMCIKHGTTSGFLLKRGYLEFHVPYKKTQYASYKFATYGKFVNIVAVTSLSQKRVYLYENGILKDSKAIEGIKHIKSNIIFGKYRSYKVYYPLDGIIDETVIWRRALRPDEIKKIAESRSLLKSLTYRIGKKYALKLYFMEIIEKFSALWLKWIDYLNIFVDKDGVNVPKMNLILSKKDQKHIKECKNLSFSHGFLVKKAEKWRKASIIFKRKKLKILFRYFEYSEKHWKNPKVTLLISFKDKNTPFKCKDIILSPVEINGHIIPLVYKNIITSSNSFYNYEMGLVRLHINHSYRGMYYYYEYDPLYKKYQDHSQMLQTLISLPISYEKFDKIYSRIDRSITPLIESDPWNPVPDSILRFHVARYKDNILKILKNRQNRPDRETLNSIANLITSKLILKDNPAFSFILSDLNLLQYNDSNLSIYWKSSKREILTEKGKLNRHPTEEQNVQLTLFVKKGHTIANKSINLTIMPKSLKLPIICITTSSAIRNTHRIPCSVKIINPTSGKIYEKFIGGIKLRGNTSLYYKKKSFSLKLSHGFRLFNFSGSKVVYLISAYADPTLMKNRLCFDLFRSFSKENYAPKIKFVELFIDHKYQGIYQLTERIDRYLLRFNKYNKLNRIHAAIYKAESRYARFVKPVHQAYKQIEPKSKYGSYWSPLDQLTLFIGKSNKKEFREHIEEVLNISNYIDFHIILNFAFNKDGTNHNLFIARNNNLRSKFIIIPWDYDKTLSGPTNRWLTNELFNRLMKDIPGFRNRFKNRWSTLRKKELSERYIYRLIDAYKAELKGALKRDANRWKLGNLHEKSIESLRIWIHNRLKAIDKIIEKF